MSNIFIHPLTVRVLIESNEKFEFNYGASWLRKIDLEVRVPYPWTLKSAHDYVKRVLDYVKIVPFENVAQMEPYMADGEALIENLKLGWAELSKVSAIMQRPSGELVEIHPWEKAEDGWMTMPCIRKWKRNSPDSSDIPDDAELTSFITLPEVNSVTQWGKASIQFIPTDDDYAMYQESESKDKVDELLDRHDPLDNPDLYIDNHHEKA